LQNDILVKVDRATMSVGLEGREPFLDHRIIQYVAQLPISFKLDGQQKRILKDIVYKYVPKSLMERPKAGFSIPINIWLKKDLSYLIDDHLSASSMSQSRFFNEKYIESMVKSFKNGTSVPFDMIWRILQFQMWYEKWC
jgi:asparagine synthase (glutamine-hydrolysing)